MSPTETALLPNGQALDLSGAKVATLEGVADRSLVVRDVAMATQAALEAPLDFPPLAKSLAPGDHVCLAVGEGVPELLAVVTGMMQALTSSGVAAHEVSIVCAAEADYNLLSAVNQELSGGAAQIHQHDSTDENALSFVGLMRGHHELKLNREVCQADVVLPVSCVGSVCEQGSTGVYDGIFPALSDAATIAHYRREAIERAERERKGHKSPSDEAGWLLGAPLVVQVVPGARGAVSAVFAGEPHAVQRAALAKHAECWRRTTPNRADLVIAVVGGAEEQQTWRNVGRALAAARRVVADGGAIALCTQLAEPVGRSVGRLIGAGDLNRVAKKIASDAAADSWTAHELLTAINRGPVYLMSRLDDDLVEELGLAPLHSTAELSRLAQRRKSCLLLEDAQQLDVTLAG